MLSRDCVYMLAADHRWQWEEWCEANHVGRDRIPEVKSLIVDGFLQAREASSSVRRFGSLLLDEAYSAQHIRRAQAEGVTVGTSAEKPGAFPLAWGSEPVDHVLTGSFVKVLIRYRPEHPRKVQEGQVERLLALQRWCRTHARPLVLEVLVPRDQEPEDEFEQRHRPAILARALEEMYGLGVTPEFWKIEATTDSQAATTIDVALARNPHCRQIILGKGAEVETITRWFAAARDSTTAVGFAIGRSVFWKPCTGYLTGRSTAAEVIEQVASNYVRLIDLWGRSRSLAGQGIRPQDLGREGE